MAGRLIDYNLHRVDGDDYTFDAEVYAANAGQRRDRQIAELQAEVKKLVNDLRALEGTVHRYININEADS